MLSLRGAFITATLEPVTESTEAVPATVDVLVRGGITVVPVVVSTTLTAMPGVIACPAGKPVVVTGRVPLPWLSVVKAVVNVVVALMSLQVHNPLPKTWLVSGTLLGLINMLESGGKPLAAKFPPRSSRLVGSFFGYIGF